MIGPSITTSIFANALNGIVAPSLETTLNLLVDTTIVSLTPSNTIEIPFVGSYQDIDWGDGNFEGAGSGTTQHVYTTGGEYTIKITAVTGAVLYGSASDRLKIKEIPNWGTMLWSDMRRAFYNCTNLTSVEYVTGPITTGVTNFEFTFRNTRITDAPMMDTSSGTTIRSMFQANPNLVSVPLYDFAIATNARELFRDCSGLNGFDLPTFNMPLVNEMSNFLSGVTISTTSYSDLLIALESVNNTVSTVLGGGNSQYNSAGETARNLLTGSPRFWAITDGGLQP